MVITSLGRPAPTNVHNFSAAADEPARHTHRRVVDEAVQYRCRTTLFA
jgi:hypothetical protein